MYWNLYLCASRLPIPQFLKVVQSTGLRYLCGTFFIRPENNRISSMEWLHRAQNRLRKRRLAKNVIPQRVHVVREEELVPETHVVIRVYDDLAILHTGQIETSLSFSCCQFAIRVLPLRCQRFTLKEGAEKLLSFLPPPSTPAQEHRAGLGLVFTADTQ